jgi:hypothetical protein
MPRFAGGKVSAIIDCSEGARPPPPMPWRMRARIRKVRFGAIPHRNDATVNSATEAM